MSSSPSLMVQNDFLLFSKEKEVLNAINNETILYSNKIQKMNSFIIKQERNIIITEESIYIFQNKKYKKKIKYEDILALTFSTISNEFIIHRKTIYDYHLISLDKIQLMCAIIKAYEKKMKKPIILCEIKEKSLKPYFTSKKEKKKDTNMTKYDKNNIIDTQTFLFDNESNNEIIMKRSHTEVYNISNNNIHNNINLDKNKTVIENYIDEENINRIIFCKENSMKNFEQNKLKYIKLLTKGKFSNIYLVQYLENNKLYVMKSINKKYLDENNNDNYKEKIEKIIKNIKHEFLINVLLCYEINERIYFLYDYIQNENLYFHIKQGKYIFDERKIKFYIASLILILEYLHKNGILYRNFNTKNILINKEGFLQLSPFSFENFFKIKINYEKKIQKNEYTAPEILENNSNENYLKSADYWNLGIIIFELIYGITPFYSFENDNINEVISKNELKFPKIGNNSKVEISENLRDLIENLLKKNYEERLNEDNIKNHEFFKNFNFDDLLNKKIESPYKPEFNNTLDSKIYEENYTYEDLIKIELLNLK